MTKILFVKIMLLTKKAYSVPCFLQKLFIQIVLFEKNFLFKIVLFKKFFFIKIMLFKYARNTQNLRILRGKLNQNVTFCVQFFFKIVLFKNTFFFKFVLFKMIFSSKSCFLKSFCDSKSDNFYKFFPKIWFLSCFSGSVWMMISSVNVNTNLFWRGK